MWPLGNITILLKPEEFLVSAQVALEEARELRVSVGDEAGGMPLYERIDAATASTAGEAKLAHAVEALMQFRSLEASVP